MGYLAMFSKTIDKSYVLGPHKMKMTPKIRNYSSKSFPN